jgi:hypothetical protein
LVISPPFFFGDELMICATLALDEVQETCEVRFWEVPSEKAPVAVICSLVPIATLGLVGVIVMEVRTAGVTVTVVEPWMADFFHNLRRDTAGGFAETLAQLLVVQFHYPALRRAEDAKCGR